MPAAPLPPMTSRQAKKLGKKSKGQFEYTASQMRRADRREELDKRKQREEEKESKKLMNKRKRDGREEKERTIKRKMFQEGKIALEDTWGKVTASQPRLNNFFKLPHVPVNKPKSAAVRTTCDSVGDPHDDVANKENRYGSQDSQEETLVTQAPVIEQTTELGDEISDIDLLKLISSQTHLSQHTPPAPVEKTTPQTRSRTRTTVSTARIMSPSILKRKRTSSPESVDNGENNFPDIKSDAALNVAEDDTAEQVSNSESELEAMGESFSSPSKSFRSILSEMSVANVNTRAQEKPDTTSALQDNGLPTPSKPKDPFASFNSGDFEDEDELTWDKENSDPLESPEKEKGKSKAKPECKSKKSEDGEPGPSTSAKKAPPRGFSGQDNFEDIYDFDFDTGGNDFDDEVDDATLMTLSTQKPRGDKLVDLHGSPCKLTPNKDPFVKPAPLDFTTGKMMPPPPPTSKLATPSKSRAERSSAEKKQESVSFASVGDDDLLEIADQVEEELSQRSQKSHKGKEVARKETFKVPALRKKRTLPWEKHPLPPPSTQDFLMIMADEVDAELDG